MLDQKIVEQVKQAKGQFAVGTRVVNGQIQLVRGNNIEVTPLMQPQLLMQYLAAAGL